MMRWEAEAELALKAVSTAAEIISERPDVGIITQKGSLRDIATDMDKGLETHITTLLRGSGHAVVGEEAQRDGVPKLTGGPFWVVDPLDGTVNYVSGMPFYAISVGLVTGDARLQWPVGAVAVPSAKELYFTHGDGGAYLNGRRLQVSHSSGLKSALVVASFSGDRGDPAMRAVQFEVFGDVNDASRGALRLGSAATAIAYVAAGRLQAAYGFSAHVWDVGGGLAIAVQAGCKTLCMRQPNSLRVHYITGVPAVVDELAQLLHNRGLPVGQESAA